MNKTLKASRKTLGEISHKKCHFHPLFHPLAFTHYPGDNTRKLIIFSSGFYAITLPYMGYKHSQYHPETCSKRW
jgi:hypothetical protein